MRCVIFLFLFKLWFWTWSKIFFVNNVTQCFFICYEINRPSFFYPSNVDVIGRKNKNGFIALPTAHGYPCSKQNEEKIHCLIIWFFFLSSDCMRERWAGLDHSVIKVGNFFIQFRCPNKRIEETRCLNCCVMLIVLIYWTDIMARVCWIRHQKVKSKAKSKKQKNLSKLKFILVTSHK